MRSSSSSGAVSILEDGNESASSIPFLPHQQAAVRGSMAQPVVFAGQRQCCLQGSGGAGLGGGKYRWEYFKNVVKVEGLNKAGAQFDFNWSGNSMIGIAFFTFLYVDIFDCTGTLYAMAKFANLLDKNGDFEGSTAAFCVDSASISIGALLGTSPLTVYIESAPGIEEGGRTGVCVLCTCVIQGEF